MPRARTRTHRKEAQKPRLRTVIYRRCTEREIKLTGRPADDQGVVVVASLAREERAYMAGLQRSSETFRRSGSSGTVWEDKHQSGELAKPARSRQQRSGSSRGYRASHVQPALDPPSPRVAACGFCSLFGKDKHHQPPRGKGRRR